MKKLLISLLLLSLFCSPVFAEKLIVDYSIVWSSEVEGLEKRIRSMILIGWQPLGGICVPSVIGPRFQAMVKYEEELQ